MTTARLDAAMTREQAARLWRNVTIRSALRDIQRGEKTAALEALIASVQFQAFLLGVGGDE